MKIVTKEEIFFKYEALEESFRKDKDRLAAEKGHEDEEYLRALALYKLAESFLKDIKKMEG